MGGFKRVFAIGVVFMAATCGWRVLGGVTSARKNEQSGDLRSNVQSLWGSQQTQKAPQLTVLWETQEQTTRTETQNGVSTSVSELVTSKHERRVAPASSKIDVALGSDLRRKGLMWYSLYDVKFGGGFSYVHEGPETGFLLVRFAFPDRSAIYDHFSFLVDGVDHASTLDPDGSSVSACIPIKPGQHVEIRASYASRGLEQWRYEPTEGVGRLKDFSLRMRTNFHDIDFPTQTMSPSKRTQDGKGWVLEWSFSQIVSGFGIGMITPTRIQPGDLAALLSFSAPISLLFFFGVIYVLATLRRIDIHPINAMDFSCERPPGALPVAQTAARDDLRTVSQALRAACDDAVSCAEAASRQLQILVGRLPRQRSSSETAFFGNSL